jgi:hypothetical protein
MKQVSIVGGVRQSFPGLLTADRLKLPAQS